MVSVPCRGIISYSQLCVKLEKKYTNGFRPLSGDYLLFTCKIKDNEVTLNWFPSPVGGLSLIQSNGTRKQSSKSGFRPLSGDYLLFIARVSHMPFS